MALFKCPDCGKEISDSSVACPNCGCSAFPVKIKFGTCSWLDRFRILDVNGNIIMDNILQTQEITITGFREIAICAREYRRRLFNIFDEYWKGAVKPGHVYEFYSTRSIFGEQYSVRELI